VPRRAKSIKARKHHAPDFLTASPLRPSNGSAIAVGGSAFYLLGENGLAVTWLGKRKADVRPVAHDRRSLSR
jgi:hypothetical protein